MNLIDELKGPMINRGLLEDAFNTLQDAINEMDAFGTKHVESQEYVSIQQAAKLLKLALELP